MIKKSKTIVREKKKKTEGKIEEKKAKKAKKEATPKAAEKKAEVILTAAAEQAEQPAEQKKLTFLYGLGRRKGAIARVKVYKNGTGQVSINNRDIVQYFPAFDLQNIVLAPLKNVGQLNKLDIQAKVQGGGFHGQAESIRLGVSRALLGLNPLFRKNLRKAGFLTRDPREKERKKYGLKRARRAPQWQKR